MSNELAKTEDAAVLSMIERAASNPEVDIEKLERLMDMQERISNRQAETDFNAAFSKAKSEMVPVIRNKTNNQTSSRYADLEIISLAIDPVVTDNGFAMSFGSEPSPTEGHYRVTCRLSHIGGHSENYQVDIPSDGTGMKGNKNKSDTHAFGSTMSYGRRYLKLMIWDVALTDDDGNAASAGATISEEMRTDIQALIEETNSDTAKFCNLLKIPSLAQMPLGKYPDALQKLKVKKAQMEKAND